MRNEREALFYIVVSRLFAERNVFHPLLRDAIVQLFLAQQRDVLMRGPLAAANGSLAPRDLSFLKACARDRGGHAILVLTLFLVPDLPLPRCRSMYAAGSLVVFIDDHGDFHSDRLHHRITYINQQPEPATALTRLYRSSMRVLEAGLPSGHGRDLMEGFLYRYYTSRMKKHELERGKPVSWAVYE